MKVTQTTFQLLLFQMLIGLSFCVYGNAEEMCPAIWYQSEKCEPDETSKCKYDTCTKDDKCQCIVELKKGTGNITGKLKSPFLRKYQAVVYIEKMEGRTFVSPARGSAVDQKNLIFTPHILPVLVGTTVDFPNSDKVRHNVFSPKESAKAFNLGTYAVGVVKQEAFEKEGVVPLLCNVHAEMSAFIVVLQNPYFATTDKRGGFTIRNVPEGEYNLTFWNEKLESMSQKVAVTAQQTAEIQFENLKRK